MAGALKAALGPNLAALLWHGSWARGEETPESDHDLIVVLKQVDEEALLAMQHVFARRGLWSTYVKSEEELRRYPMTGRLQFHHGLVVLHGSFDPPPVTKEGLIEEMRRLATDIAHEARYRIIHASGREYFGMDADYVRIRTARWLYYQAKLAVLAMKTREVVRGGSYPANRAELKARLTDDNDISLLDTVDRWADVKSEYSRDFMPLAFMLDRFVQKLVSELPQS